MLSFSEAAPNGPFRGELVDIGGRRLRIVLAGDGAKIAGLTPTIVFEAGAFGTAADWAVIQDEVSGLARSIAYDRAGLGYSDPGPQPRNSAAVVQDLEALLTAAREPPPYVIVAHSMAPVFAYLFALQRPEWVKGLVLVDATPPDSMTDPMVAGMVQHFADCVGFASLTASMGMNMMAQTLLGDDIGLSGLARAEKDRSIVSTRHNYWAAMEARDWLKNGAAARAAGSLSPDLPVAVVSAGHGLAGWKTMQAAPALRSLHGRVEDVEQATHASLLGPRYADAVVRGVEHVLKMAAMKS